MWCVIQTLGGTEIRTADMIQKLASPDCLAECFVPKRERLKKFHGCWNKVEDVLFQGYIFAASEKPEELYEELKRIPGFTRILGREEGWFSGLGEQEETFVRGIGDERHKTSISRITVEKGKKIRVVDGPLKDYEGAVVKVDLHRKEVTVKIEFLGRDLKLKMGIEMVDNK